MLKKLFRTKFNDTLLLHFIAVIFVRSGSGYNIKIVKPNSIKVFYNINNETTKVNLVTLIIGLTIIRIVSSLFIYEYFQSTDRTIN